MFYAKKIITALIAMMCVMVFIGCSDKSPPPLGEIAVDLSEDYLDGRWDVWLEIRKDGDRTNVYKSKLRFNLTSSIVEQSGSFSVEWQKSDKSPERFSDLPGFQPEYVGSSGLLSIEESDVIYIWFEKSPEYKFRTRLTKDENGYITGYGSISFGEDEVTFAELHIIQFTKWSTAIIDVCSSCNKEIQAGWDWDHCRYCGAALN